jgi:hypothetical protein
MLDSDLAAFIERDRQALDAIVRGDPELKKSLYSRRDDVTLANPFGPPARGWQKVAEALERAASQLREGRVIGFDRISEYTTAELANIVEIERYHGKAGTSEPRRMRNAQPPYFGARTANGGSCIAMQTRSQVRDRRNRSCRDERA